METFTAASHHDVLKLIIQIAVLLLTARLLSEVARRLGQPSVIGEILAGILLGPSILSGLLPAFGQWIVPSSPTQGYLIEVISLLGAMFLMLTTGFETDLGLIRRHARTAIGVSIGGIIVTFATGYFLGANVLPESLLGNPQERQVFALFLGIAMSISAIAVIAKVIIDMNLTRRDVGQTILAAGMSDDTIGWILLSGVAAVAAGHTANASALVRSGVTVIAFMALSLTLGRTLIRRLVQYTQDRITMPERMVTLGVALMFVWGAMAHALEFEAVLGAFVLGIILGQVRLFPEEARHTIETVGLAIFAPVFFAVAGLKVDLRKLATPELLKTAAIVILATTAAKAIGTYSGARLIGRKDHWTALAFATGLNTRGAMDIIIATIGLQLGVLGQDMFSIIVLMAMTNSILAPAALRWVLRRVKPSEEEQARLKQEELADKSSLGPIHRVLTPIRFRPDVGQHYTAESVILERLARHSDLSLTLMTATHPGERAIGQEFLSKVRALFPEKDVTLKVVEGTSPAELILDESQKGYDLMVLGATRSSNSRVLFNPMVDYLLRVAPCMTMVIKSDPTPTDWSLRRILVPTNGALPARRAAELAFALATDQDEVILLNVAARDLSGFDPDGSYFRRQLGSGRQIVDDLRELGEAQNIRTEAEVRIGRNPDVVIIDVAKERSVDLIILGTDVRPGSQRLFLGPRVERILNNAPCPVLVVNAS